MNGNALKCWGGIGEARNEKKGDERGLGGVLSLSLFPCSSFFFISHFLPLLPSPFSPTTEGTQSTEIKGNVLKYKGSRERTQLNGNKLNEKLTFYFVHYSNKMSLQKNYQHGSINNSGRYRRGGCPRASRQTPSFGLKPRPKGQRCRDSRVPLTSWAPLPHIPKFWIEKYPLKSETIQQKSKRMTKI